MCMTERSKMSEPYFHYFTRITNKFVIYQEATKLTFMAFSFHEFPELSFLVHCRITKSTYFLVLLFTKVRKAFLESTILLSISLIQFINYKVFKTLKQHYSLFPSQNYELQPLAQESTNYDYESGECRVTAIILDTVHYRLFRPIRSDLLSAGAKTHFIKLNFIDKGIDAVNLPSILRSKSVIETVPTYFKEKEPPIISYTNTKTIASKLFKFS